MKITHAGGLVYKKKEGEILFLVLSATGRSDQWVLPKGHIEEGETPEFTAIREILEETGVLAMPIKQICDLEYDKPKEIVKVRYFLMKYNQEISTSKEQRIIKWLDKQDAMNILSFDDAKEVLESAYENNSKI